MKRNIDCSLLFLLVLAFGGAGALAQQTNLPPDTTSPEQRDAATLEVLISEAWTNNPEVRLFEAAVAGARGELITAKTWSNPEVSFAPGAVRTEESGSPSRTGFHGDFGISQTFSFPGKRALQRAVAEKTVQSRQLALTAFRTQLRHPGASLVLPIAGGAADGRLAATAHGVGPIFPGGGAKKSGRRIRPGLRADQS